MNDKSCPCNHTTPCHPRCTCVQEESSVGCSRCCKYGSDDQRKARAEYLAKMVAPDLYQNLLQFHDSWARDYHEAQGELAKLGKTVTQLISEVEMLRGVGCREAGDGPCGVCLKCAVRGTLSPQLTTKYNTPDASEQAPIECTPTPEHPHCAWYDTSYDDFMDPAPMPESCSEKAEFVSCVPYANAPTCRAHKCRCAKPFGA